MRRFSVAFLVLWAAGCGDSGGGAGRDAATDTGPTAVVDDPAADRVLTCTTTTERPGDLYELDTDPGTLRTLVRVAAGRPCAEYRVALWVPGPTCPASPPIPPACGSLEPVLDELGLYLDGQLTTIDGQLVALVERATIRASVAVGGRPGFVLDAVELVGAARRETDWGEPTLLRAERSEGLFLDAVVRDGDVTSLRYMRDGRIRPSWRTQEGRAATDGIYEARLRVELDVPRIDEPRRISDVSLPLRDLLRREER